MSTRLLTHSLYTLYESRLKGRQTLAYLSELQQSQWLSGEEIRALQWQRLQRLLVHACEQSPYYAKIFAELGMRPEDIESLDDFRRLPIQHREHVVANHDAMIASNYRNRLIHKTTGGSTGVPVRLALDRRSYEWRTAVAQRGYSWANCDIGQHTLYIWSGDVGEKPLTYQLKNKLYHWVMNREMFNCFDFGDDEKLRCIAYINEQKPDGIVAFTTPIYDLAVFIRDRNIPLDRTAVKAIVTGAERLHDHQREVIESVFGVKVFNTYGCREVMLIASECEKHEGLHVNADSLLVEILVDGRPAEPGETGEVVVTDLHNYGMPLIRYRNGDLATQSRHVCSCGRGLPLIEGVEGRILDRLTTTGGTRISGAFIPHLMKEVPEVAKYQVVQKERGLLEVRIIEKSPLPETQFTFIREQLRRVLGQDMEVSFRIMDDIPVNASGKFRTTISELRD